MREVEGSLKPLVAVTGASSGIGSAVARRFAAAGHPLLLMARRLDRLEELDLPNAVLREVDVTDRDALESAFEAGVAAFGPVDVLVNNAGLMPLNPVVDQPADDWQRMFDVNCVAILNASQIVMPSMIDRRQGTIINLGSIAGKAIYPNHAAYCGSKFAVHAITEGMRRELAPHNVRVILIAPGMIDTELLTSNTPQGAVRLEYEAYRSSIGGAIPPEHVANAMVIAYGFPQSVCVRELVLAPTAQDA